MQKLQAAIPDPVHSPSVAVDGLGVGGGGWGWGGGVLEGVRRRTPEKDCRHRTRAASDGDCKEMKVVKRFAWHMPAL